MKRIVPTAVHLAALLAAALSLASAAHAHDPKKVAAQPTPTSAASGHHAGDHGMPGHDMSKMTPSQQLHHAMKSGSKAMPMSGDVDRDFATMMTMHHEQAIKMADILIRHGKSAELKALARKMKTAQQAEIQQMARYTK